MKGRVNPSKERFPPFELKHPLESIQDRESFSGLIGFRFVNGLLFYREITIRIPVIDSSAVLNPFEGDQPTLLTLYETYIIVHLPAINSFFRSRETVKSLVASFQQILHVKPSSKITETLV
ncbi:MAG: hypothetical protein WC996_05130 [Peptostreptococcales bacterium]